MSSSRSSFLLSTTYPWLIHMMAMGVTLLNLRCVVIIVLLFRSAEALQQKASTLHQASMSIYAADLLLREQSTALGAHCGSQLDAAHASLHRASTQVVLDPDAARQSLALVDAILQSCSQNSQHALVLLSRVAKSVASARHLINQGKVPDDLQDALDASTSLITTRVEDAEAVSISMHDLVVDFCPNHVALTASSATICLDRSCGGQFHTRAKYAAGVFSMRMRAPQGAPGVSNSFYVSSNDEFPDSISFDFVGHEPHRVLTSYAVAGNHSQKLKTFHMSFDTTAELHEYTIKWDANSIVWIVDGVILRQVRSSRKPLPTKPGHVFGYSWVADQRVSWYDGPYFMSFRDLQVQDPNQWLPPRQQRRISGLHPLVIDYCPNNIAVGESSVDISFDERGCGGRVRSLRTFSSGRFSARVQCAAGDTSGLLTSFYLSSGEGSATQDEIDFEFLGNNKSIVQTNFYVNGSCGANELSVELGFDCSSGLHEYAVEFSESWIRWFVDERLVRTVNKDDVGTAAFPRQKMYLYSSVWNASFVYDGRWTGKWHGMGEVPFVAKFKDVTMQQF